MKSEYIMNISTDTLSLKNFSDIKNILVLEINSDYLYNENICRSRGEEKFDSEFVIYDLGTRAVELFEAFIKI